MKKIFAIVIIAVSMCSCVEPVPIGEANLTYDESDLVDLDMREANVIAVNYNAKSGQFDVTLVHDDDGETGYADWWQLETLDGDFIDRRVLTHRHDSKPFTRSLFVDDLSVYDYVVVRGHDHDHGYGGQLAILDVATKEYELIDQGSEAQNFVDYPQ